MNIVIILLIVLILMNLCSSIISTSIFIRQLRKDIKSGKYANKQNLKQAIEHLHTLKTTTNDQTAQMLADELIDVKEKELKKI